MSKSNRRNFIGNLLALGAGFTILPPAATGRIWKATRPVLENPYAEIVTTGLDMSQFGGKWKFITGEQCASLGIMAYDCKFESVVAVPAEDFEMEFEIP